MIKQSKYGAVVVEDKETGIRYALSDSNVTDDHKIIRELKANESTRTYKPCKCTKVTKSVDNLKSQAN